jgi:hypothetical protein
MCGFGQFDDGACSVFRWGRSKPEAAQFAWRRRCFKSPKQRSRKQRNSHLLDVELLAQKRRQASFGSHNLVNGWAARRSQVAKLSPIFVLSPLHDVVTFNVVVIKKQAGSDCLAFSRLVVEFSVS